MFFETYFEEVNAQKQIDKWAKKCKNKKIVLYGAGSYFEEVIDNCDLSKLNIIGVSDLRFERDKNSNISKYPSYSPKELKDLDYDIILLTVIEELYVIEYLKEEILAKSKNRFKPIKALIKPSIFYIIKNYLENR